MTKIKIILAYLRAPKCHGCARTLTTADEIATKLCSPGCAEDSHDARAVARQIGAPRNVESR